MSLIKYCPVCKEKLEHLEIDSKKFKHPKNWYRCSNCRRGFIILGLFKATVKEVVAKILLGKKSSIKTKQETLEE